MTPVISLEKSVAARAVKRPPRVRKPLPPAPRRRSTVLAAAGVFLVALILLGLSLSHLANGIVMVTGSSDQDAWAMAAGIDLGFTALELALIVAPAAARPAVARYAGPAILGTIIVSAAMNSFAFAAHANGWLVWPAIALGLAVPALVYALIKAGAALFFQTSEQLK